MKLIIGKTFVICSLVDLNDEELFEISKYITIHDFYHLWCITFPSKDADKEKHNLPPILFIPSLAILESDSTSQEKTENTLLLNDVENELNQLAGLELADVKVLRLPANANFKLLPVETINERLLNLSNEIFTPVILLSDIFSKEGCSDSTCESLPLLIRETTFDYQCERVMLFKALLNGKGAQKTLF